MVVPNDKELVVERASMVVLHLGWPWFLFWSIFFRAWIPYMG